MSAIAVTNISKSFYLQDGGKNQLAYAWNKITSLSTCTAIADLFVAVAEVRLFGAGEYFPE